MAESQPFRDNLARLVAASDEQDSAAGRQSDDGLNISSIRLVRRSMRTMSRSRISPPKLPEAGANAGPNRWAEAAAVSEGREEVCHFCPIASASQEEASLPRFAKSGGSPRAGPLWR